MLLIVNAPIGIKRPGVLFLEKTGKTRSKRPLSKQKLRKTPRPHSKRPPPTIFWGKRSAAELASHLNVGDGDVSDAGKGVLYVGKLICGCVRICFA